MKTLWIILLAICSVRAAAQWHEAAQLALNIEKLNQLRQILDNMYTGYKILTEGYNKVKDITEGNYKLHEFFLDGLMTINPKIKNFERVGDIINYQLQILKEYKNAFQRFNESKIFTGDEIKYIGNVYSNLFDRSIDNVDELIIIITSGKLRMNDAERLSAINNIYDRIIDQISFLRSFNQQAAVLGLQRAKEINDVRTIGILYGLTK
jgi:hypothetical protein